MDSRWIAVVSAKRAVVWFNIEQRMQDTSVAGDFITVYAG